MATPSRPVVITTPEQRLAVLAEIGELMKGDPDINTPEADRLNELTEALIVYEQVYFPL